MHYFSDDEFRRKFYKPQRGQEDIWKEIFPRRPLRPPRKRQRRAWFARLCFWRRSVQANPPADR